MKHTEQTRQKLSRIRKGNKNPFYGRRHTPETIAKIRASCKQNCKGQLDLADVSIKLPVEPFDLGYLAGIIDGEGSIGLRRQRTFVAVYNNDATLMRWLESNIGGNVGWDADKRGREPNHTWSISAARDVYYLCVTMLPYLKIKKTDAQDVTTYLEQKYGERLNG